MSRQIILDTETTGLDVTRNHKIIEIGCIELIDRKFTGNKFHMYLNPMREIDQGAISVHGITNEFLQDKPLFGDVKKDLIQTSKLVKDEWKIIDEKLGLFELEKKELLTNFPVKVQNLYDELKTRGVDVIAAYRLENNQCGCCGVDLTTSELDSIFEKEFQQCPYCDGVLV